MALNESTQCAVAASKQEAEFAKPCGRAGFERKRWVTIEWGAVDASAACEDGSITPQPLGVFPHIMLDCRQQMGCVDEDAGKVYFSWRPQAERIRL